MGRLWQRLQSGDATSFVAIVVCCIMGYARGPLWLAVVGGALFWVPSMVELILLKQRHPSVPTNWKVLSFYLGALGNGMCAAVAGYFMGFGWRAYFFPG